MLLLDDKPQKATVTVRDTHTHTHTHTHAHTRARGGPEFWNCPCPRASLFWEWQGNVWEICQSRTHRSRAELLGPGTDPLGVPASLDLVWTEHAEKQEIPMPLDSLNSMPWILETYPWGGLSHKP
jgi:hypothetical protein